MGYLNRFQGYLLTYANAGTVQEVQEISHQRQVISVQGTPIWTVHSSHEVYGDNKVKLMATHRGIRFHQNLDNWLVRARSHQVSLQHIQELVRICQKLGWLVNMEISELEPKQVFDFIGDQFRPQMWPGPTDSGPVGDPWQLAVHVLNRSANNYSEASSPWPTAHKAHSVASQNSWRVPESLEKVIPIPNSLHPHLKWWLEESNMLHGQPLHPVNLL